MQPLVRTTAWVSGLTLLRREGLWERVRERVPAATSGLFDVQAGDWMPLEPFDDVTEALSGLGGEELVRRLGRLGAHAAVVAPVRLLLKGLGALAVAPHALLSRVDAVTRRQSRGISATYRRIGSRSGEVRLAYAGDRDIPRSRLVGMAGRFEALLELTGAEGGVGEPVVERRGASFRVDWR